VGHNIYEFLDGSGNIDAAKLPLADADHDPFDIFRRDRIAFRLQPLIYSAGNDERYGIERNDETQIWYATFPVQAQPAPNYFRPRPTPYERTTQTLFMSMPAVHTGTTVYSNGTIDTRAEDATDNIHNHLIEATVRR
jgi:hypothetical protein